MRTARLFRDLRSAARYSDRLRTVDNPAELLEGLRESEPELFQALADRAAARRRRKQRRSEIAAANQRLIEAKRTGRPGDGDDRP
jgi:hypothetical protein